MAQSGWRRFRWRSTNATTRFYKASRLTTLTTNVVTGNDFTIGGSTTPITYNPASQIISAPRSNDAYAWPGAVAVNRGYTANGLNQYSSAGSASFTYDANGNLTSDGTNTYAYSNENQLTSAPGATLSYDPLMRMYQVTGSTTTGLVYDGLNITADYDSTGALQHRYVFGPKMDEPIVEYAGTGTTSRTFLSADERGSIIARTNASGTLLTANTYDEYGIPGSGNAGLFQYTGQAWISQLGFYYYKARMYSPTLGRFMQTDPIGYEGDGPNLYAHTLNDPVNYVDPLGLSGCDGSGEGVPASGCGDIIITSGGGWGSGGGVPNIPREPDDPNIIHVIGKRLHQAASTVIRIFDNCSDPFLSNQEQRADAAGDRVAFWASRARRGDPYGPIGLTTATNSSFLGQEANFRLRDAITTRSPNISTAELNAEVEQIGVDIMRQYVTALSRGDVSPSQFADIHFVVFAAHGLPRSTYGAAPIFGSHFEANLFSPLYRFCNVAP